MSSQPDGIHQMIPREQMAPAVRKLRDAYDLVPGAPLYHREFWLMPGALERWAGEGMPQDVSHAELFHYDDPAVFGLGGLGWCEAAFVPCFEEKVIEDRGDHEVAQDYAGRHVLFFKDRRVGFMPEYLSHPLRTSRRGKRTSNGAWTRPPPAALRTSNRPSTPHAPLLLRASSYPNASSAGTCTCAA